MNTQRIYFPNPLIKERGRSFSSHDVKLSEPNDWFAERFPVQTLQFGSAFLEVKTSSLEKIHCLPLYPNEDFFGAILGGDKRIGVEVVYLALEDMFYFYDYRIDAFCPVSEAKLKLLLSNFMIRCAQDSVSYVDVRNLVIAFRKDEVLCSIIKKAKAILEVDQRFFSGENGKRRMIDHIYHEPDAEPSYKLFVYERLSLCAGSILTVPDAYARYNDFCKRGSLPVMIQTQFKRLVTELIEEKLNVGIRHDLVGSNGRMQHGWSGIKCLSEAEIPVG